MSIFQLKYSFKYLVLKISKDVLSLISFDILFQRLHSHVSISTQSTKVYDINAMIIWYNRINMFI